METALAHLKRMVGEAIAEIRRRAEAEGKIAGPCPDGGWGCHTLHLFRRWRPTAEKEADFCRRCWSNYLDRKAKEAEEKHA